MKPIEIPPRFRVFVYRAFDPRNPDGIYEHWKLVASPDEFYADRFVREFESEQGLDIKFRLVSEVSLSDLHVYQDYFYQCALAL